MCTCLASSRTVHSAILSHWASQLPRLGFSLAPNPVSKYPPLSISSLLLVLRTIHHLPTQPATHPPAHSLHTSHKVPSALQSQPLEFQAPFLFFSPRRLTPHLFCPPVLSSRARFPSFSVGNSLDSMWSGKGKSDPKSRSRLHGQWLISVSYFPVTR